MVATKTESELLLDFGGSFVIKLALRGFSCRLVFSFVFNFGDGYTFKPWSTTDASQIP